MYFCFLTKHILGFFPFSCDLVFPVLVFPSEIQLYIVFLNSSEKHKKEHIFSEKLHYVLHSTVQIFPYKKINARQNHCIENNHLSL